MISACGRILVAAISLGWLSAKASSVGVDSSLPVPETHALWQTVGPQLPPKDVSWLRVRHIALAFRPVGGRWIIDPDRRAELRNGLAALRRDKLRIIGFIDLDRLAWTSPRNVAGRGTLPGDLRDAQALALALRAEFDDLVDVWEVGNEPEIFYPETAPEYAAVLKAFYLGYHTHGDAKARVVMAAMGKPAGRYLDTLVRNGLLSFTDAFNLHVYGFAEDVRPFFDEHLRAAAAMARRAGPLSGEPRSLPVFMTELGYGGIPKEDANDPGSRERQAWWFWRVGKDFARSGPEARLAFVLKPYVSPLSREMGMIMRDGVVAPALREWWTSEVPGAREVRLRVTDRFRRVPIVLDVAVEATPSLDRTGWQAGQPIRATLFVYNFGSHPVAATLALPGAVETWSGPSRVQIAPGGREAIPFTVSLVRTAADLDIVAQGDWGISNWHAPLRRSDGFAAAGRPLDLGFNARDNARARVRMLSRPLAFEEPAMQPQGRWLVTPGVEVEERPDVWRITIRNMPPDARWRRATAELVLPAPVVPAMLGQVRWECHVEGEGRTELELQWRTRQGALFGAPFIVLGSERRLLVRPWESFEQVFFARAARRWRLEENELASVVLAFRPLSSLPVTVAISKFSARVLR